MSVTPTLMPSASQTKEIRLSTLRRGDGGRITRIDTEELEIALLKIGVTSGDQLVFSGAAPLGGPIAIRTQHIKLSLRREDAMNIWITPSS